MSTLSDQIAKLSPEKRAALERILKQRAATQQPVEVAPAILPVARDREHFPLSSAEQRLWFLDRFSDTGAAFNLHAGLLLRGPLDQQALASAVDRLVARHEILRTRYVLNAGEPTRRTDGSIVPTLQQLDLSSLPEPEQRARQDQLIVEHAKQRFDLEQGGLFSATLLQLASEHHILLLAMHHIVSDAWSMTLILDELWDNYGAILQGAPPVPPPSVQYLDYAVWQQQELQGARLAKQLDYWQDQLRGAPDLIELPTDRPRPATQTFAGHELQFRISDDLLQPLKRIAREANASLFMVTLSCYVALLHRWSGQGDLVVGTDVANRNYAETESLIGFLVNQLALRFRVDQSTTYHDLLVQTRGTCLQAFANQDLPFNQLVERLNMARDLSRTPLYQVKFMLQNTAAAREEDTALQATYLEQIQSTSQFDLLLALAETKAGGMLGSLRYRTDLFDQATAERLVAHYLSMLEQMAFAPTRPLSELTWLSPPERAQLAHTNDTRRRIEAPLLPDWFDVAAVKHATRPALTCAQTTLTYAEVQDRVHRLAAHLLELGVQPEQPVAVCLGRGIDMVIALLAVLRSGACYVPLDPEYGAERIAYMLADCGARIAICDEQQVALPEAITTLPINAIASAPVSRATRWPALHPEQVAYIIYTSGSTGRPKGVAVRHQGLCNFLVSMQDKTGLSEDDTLLAVTTISFDIAALELYLPLLCGARVVVATREEVADGRKLLATSRAEKVSVLQATPSTWRMVLQAAAGSALPLLGLCGGEALPQELALQLLAAGVRLMNVYGPTETTIWSAAVELSDASIRDVSNAPLGVPLANTTLHVLNDLGHPVPIGVPGELCIGGDGLARGYCNNPAQTAAAFLPDPYAGASGARLYRTGDLVRWLGDGRLSFLGRLDHQVKVRGYRIELGEIESVLGQFPAIASAVVVTRRDTQGSAQLVAFVRPSAEPLDVDALRRFAGLYLPPYMVPGEMHRVDAFPLTMNGKIDRKALAALATAQAHNAQSEASIVPDGELACQVAEIWRSVLGLATAYMDQDFFRCGGHSLLAVQLLDRVERALNVTLALPDLFRRPTLGALVDDIARRRDSAVTQETVTDIVVQSDPASADAPFPLTSIQQAYWLGRSGSFELGNIATQNYLEIDIVDLDPARFGHAWNQLVSRHGMLRAVFAIDGSQRILPSLPLYQPRRYDLRNNPDAESVLLNLRQEMKSQILPADVGPLFDLRFSQIDDTHWRVHFCIDMLISDVVSNHILFAELGQLYRQPESSLAPIAISFRDYVLAEQALLASPRFERAKRYWLDRLPTFPSRPDLPLARDPARLEQQQFSRRRQTISAAHWQVLKQRAQSLQVSPTGFVLTAFSEVLGTWSKDPRFALNLTLFNRLPLHRDVESLVGDFTSSLLLACEYVPEQPFASRAKALQQRLWHDLEHKLFSGVDMIRELARARGGSHGAAMPVVFTSILGLETPGQGHESAAAEDAQEGYSASQTSQVWLDHQVAEQNGGLTLVWDALDAVFPDGMLDDMFAAYSARLVQLAEHSDSWQVPHNLTPPHQIERRARINDVPFLKSSECLHTLMVHQAQLRPNDVAVQTPTFAVDYHTLDRWSDALACALIRAGAGKGDLIAVLMHKGWEQIVAVLAVIKAGAAYMPVDADLPDQRKAQVIAEGGARIALVQPDTAFALDGLHCLSLDPNVLDALPAGTPSAHVTPDDIAYVIFTSGSTGKPKGVVIGHRGAVNTVLDINDRFGVRAGDSVLALSSLSFDLSVYDIFGILAVGGTIVLPEYGRHDNAAHWWECVDRFQVTVWNTVPALMQLLVDHCERLPEPGLGPIRVVMMSGDWIPVSLPDRIRALADDAAVYSLGGATEASIWSIYYPVTEATSGWRSVPYGRPLGNQSFHVLDSAMQPRPEGVTGPLYIGGIGLAKGYWRDPVRTALSFVPGSDGAMLYRTGDLGRYLPDGNIEFLGREDAQVKVQGYRIELGDIETSLQSHPDIAQAAVNAIGDHQDSKTLVAYVVAKQQVAGNDGGGRIQDPNERTLFKLEQRGIRRFGDGHPRITITTPALDMLMQGLRAHRMDDQPLPKYRYASAASLYPVQVYVSVPPSLSSTYALNAGTHYYHPMEHRLIQLDDDLGTDARAPDSLTLRLIADLDAIEPLYGQDESRRFCLLEAGYLAAVVQDAAQAHGVVLSVRWSTERIHAAALPPRALQLGSIVLGVADVAPIASSSASPIEPTDLIALPPPKSLEPADHLLQRQSFRRFADRGCSLDQIAAVLAMAQVDQTDTLLHVQPGQALPSGWYRYWPGKHALSPEPIALDGAALFNDANSSIYRHAGFAVLMVGEPSDRQFAAVGQRSQALMERCWRLDVGVCPVGAIQDPAASALTVIGEREFLHGFIAGAIDAEQWRTWEPNATPKATLTAEELAAYLAARLPAYMVPRVFVGLDALPLSANGKVDRKALPKPDMQRPSQAFEAPVTDTERLLATLWCQLLKIDQVGRHDSFFDLGGNSLVAMQLASRLRIDHGIELSIRDVFEHPVLSALGSIVSGSQPEPGVPVVDAFERLRADWLAQHPAGVDHAWYPLSLAQQQLFAHQQLDATATAYNISSAMHLDGDLDTGRLRNALQALVDRHEALRTRFEYRDGAVWQRVDHVQRVAFDVVDFSALDRTQAEAKAREWLTDAAIRPFDLFKGPLLRACLLTIEPNRRILMLSIHHIIADYLSMEILVDDLNRLYSEADLVAKALPLHFTDAVLWEADFLRSAEATRQREFWLQHLHELPRLEWRDTKQNHDGWQSFKIDGDLLTRLRARTRASDLSMFMLGFATLHQLLANLSGQTDFAIGTPISTRRVPNLEPCIGLLLNTLPIRLVGQQVKTGTQLLHATRRACMEAFEHKDYPCEALQSDLRRTDQTQDEPLYRVRYVYRRIDASTARNVAERQVDVTRRDAKFDLLFTLNEADDHAFGEFEYRGAAFSDASIGMLNAQLMPLLTWLADQPDDHLSSLTEKLGTIRETYFDDQRKQQASKLGARLKLIRR
ncbi:hypothetical protein C7S18_07980 [Ahniella affigens]|uniref:Carrier domain-containing protein n=1 Tax=Ahniella affigens TaxID=2021234 RepID=A0A2P1PQL8_9GAMM|nr:non-ribosomal peptide synthetase [Ahniella affigens]AVP97134.1 hypothetical protein C7S18_07980 [Ahniella affigens]